MARSVDVLIPQIYEAAVEPEEWPAVLTGLSRLTGHTTTYLCHVPLLDPTAGVTWTHAFDPESLARYKRSYAGPQYQGVRAMLTSRVGSLLDRREIADDRAWESDPGHQAFLGEQGLFHGLVSPVHRDRRTFSALICMRERQRGPIDGEERDAVALLLPHLSRAIRIHQKIAALTDQSAAFAGALHALNVGVVTLDRELTIHFANVEAERALAAADGLNSIRGRMVLTDSGKQAELAGAVARAASPRGSGEAAYVFVPRPSAATDFTLLVTSGSAVGAKIADISSRACATVFITDPASVAHLPSADVIAARFGLTSTEAEVTRLTAAGQGTPYVARTLRVSVNTARTHLKSVYSKTGVNQQTQLTRLILETFPPVAHR